MMIEPLTVNGIFPSWNKGNSATSKIAVFFRINGVFMENKFPAPGEIFHKSQSSDLAKYGDIGTKMRPPVEGCNTYIQTFFYMKLQPGDFFIIFI